MTTQALTIYELALKILKKAYRRVRKTQNYVKGSCEKNCRTLIDSLAKDLEQDQHVFMRHKNNR